MNSSPEIPGAIEVGEADFQSEVLESKQPVLVTFCAPWSHPCQVLDSTLAEVARVCGHDVKVVRVNADENPYLSVWYEIQSVPTLLYFIDGIIRAKVVGTVSKEKILSKFQLVSKQVKPGARASNPTEENEHDES